MSGVIKIVVMVSPNEIITCTNINDLLASKGLRTEVDGQILGNLERTYEPSLSRYVYTQTLLNEDAVRAEKAERLKLAVLKQRQCEAFVEKHCDCHEDHDETGGWYERCDLHDFAFEAATFLNKWLATWRTTDEALAMEVEQLLDNHGLLD